MDARAREAYDAMADAYVADERNAYNALYERPATLAALGDVRGRRVLDAGCGAGALAAELVARGATVDGVDVSPRMVDRARARGLDRDAARFAVGDLADGAALAAFADDAFDAAAASLMVHYLRDWAPLLGELARVVVPGGRVVVSTHHPALVARQWPDVDPEATVLLHDRWVKDGAAYDVRFWHRPLSAMLDAFAAAGLEVEELVEPAPLRECRAADPVAWERLTSGPWFLVAVLSAPGRTTAGRRPA
ncbi:MAG TPA: methyltransferase domain-containing protein [Baekduia sp.]|uniref:methyltransferase domain-containing protein n=1 Tax=Baekduia sp. TaxID=2600305 RepID=UPI002D76AF3A|nr:methyltransferase domain-containing protein [Baekduia sp.]HET6506643.1 methyltransferase domain-containing protein [Baekduia sp.]